jgi:hypothetical protein
MFSKPALTSAARRSLSISTLLAWSNLRNFLRGSPRSREISETRALYHRVRAVFERSPYARDGALADFCIDIVKEACNRAEVTPVWPLMAALLKTVDQLLMEDDPLIFGFPDPHVPEALTPEEGVALRTFLRDKERFLQDGERLADIWREKVIRILEGIMAYLPATVFREANDDDESSEETIGALSVAFIDLCEAPAEVIDRLVGTLYDQDIIQARLFEPVREQFERNLLRASGIALEERYTSKRPAIFAVEAKGSPRTLVERYLGGTGFKLLLETQLPFAVPFPARFEHTHIVGGSGHGKTQLMQLMILKDLLASREDYRSIVVIDSQGDLIQAISHLEYFSPRLSNSLADRLLIVDPNDVEFPTSLNMFDFNRERLKRYRPVDRERILNGIIELYEFIFGALLGAELTARQGVIFKYLARLMVEIPDATIHTFRELMEDGGQFRPYMERLPPTARSFFMTRFFDRSFTETKRQVLTRLWGVLSNAVFDRMFSQQRNAIDMFDAMNSGKIVLINTAKELLKQDGCAIFGRFFIALIAQAVLQRANLAGHERNPTFVYIDEAQDYFDENIDHLLNQARKYRVGMVLAHQNLDQLSAGLRASVMASTSIKFAGGVSAKDARVFGEEMRCDADFVQSMRKRRTETDFACFIRNVTGNALTLSIPLGAVEAMPRITDVEFSELVNANRAGYCTPFDEAVYEPPRIEPEALRSAEVEPELQPAVTTPAESASAEVEQGTESKPPTRPLGAPVTATPAIPPKRRAAPTKTATSEPAPMGRGGVKHKYFQQLFKQLAEERGFRASIEEPVLGGTGRVDVAITAGTRRIACEISVTSTRDQELGNIEKCLAAGYDQVALVASEQRYLTTMRKLAAGHLEPEVVERVRFFLAEEFIGYLDELKGQQPTEETVRGYKVKVTRRPIDPAEAEERKRAIAGVIARSLR